MTAINALLQCIGCFDTFCFHFRMCNFVLVVCWLCVRFWSKEIFHFFLFCWLEGCSCGFALCCWFVIVLEWQNSHCTVRSPLFLSSLRLEAVNRLLAVVSCVSYHWVPLAVPCHRSFFLACSFVFFCTRPLPHLIVFRCCFCCSALSVCAEWNGLVVELLQSLMATFELLCACIAALVSFVYVSVMCERDELIYNRTITILSLCNTTSHVKQHNSQTAVLMSLPTITPL